MRATPFWNLNFKRAWQAEFLSQPYDTLENYLFFIDLKMTLVPFFKIHDGLWDKNFVHRCHIHILSHPWPIRSNVHPAFSCSCVITLQPFITLTAPGFPLKFLLFAPTPLSITLFQVPTSLKINFSEEMSEIDILILSLVDIFWFVV